MRSLYVYGLARDDKEHMLRSCNIDVRPKKETRSTLYLEHGDKGCTEVRSKGTRIVLSTARPG